jgi:hypothetical protein
MIKHHARQLCIWVAITTSRRLRSSFSLCGLCCIIRLEGQFLCYFACEVHTIGLIGHANLALVLLLSLAGRKYAVRCRVAVDFEGFGCICCLYLRVPNLTEFGHHYQRKQSTGGSAAKGGFGPCSKGRPTKNLTPNRKGCTLQGGLISLSVDK